MRDARRLDGRKLRELRLKRDPPLLQEDLAVALGCTQQVISCWELNKRGTRISYTALCGLARLLSVLPEALLIAAHSEVLVENATSDVQAAMEVTGGAVKSR